MVNVMKIGSQSQTLVSLNSLLNASKEQQQIQRDQLQEKKLEEGRDARISARNKEREELIQQNRDALRKIQDDIRLKNLRKLQENNELEDDIDSKRNLNLRESFLPTPVASNQPAFEKLGQIVDIKI